jgi:hypothetical protein
LSLDSYESYQLPPSYHLDDDLAEVMFGSPIMEDVSVKGDLYLDASEMTMLELLVSCDSSKACHGFYDDRLMLLR